MTKVENRWVEPQPELVTKRLLLRAFRRPDAADVQRLAGDAAIADTTLTIPHPYADGMAEAWIESCADRHARGEEVVYAVTTPDGALIGAVGLRLESEHHRAELGYWIGVPYWGRGYATEAARAVVAHAFDALGLNRVYARHFTRNPASGRVLQKVGMAFEGIERQHLFKAGRFEDLACYAILRSASTETTRESA